MGLDTATRDSKKKGRRCYRSDQSVGSHGPNGKRATLTGLHGVNRDMKGWNVTPNDGRCCPYAPAAQNQINPDIAATALSSSGQTVRSSHCSLRRQGWAHHRARTIWAASQAHRPTADAAGTAGNSRTFGISCSGQYWERRRHGPAPQHFGIALFSAVTR